MQNAANTARKFRVPYREGMRALSVAVNEQSTKVSFLEPQATSNSMRFRAVVGLSREAPTNKMNIVVLASFHEFDMQELENTT